MKFFKKTLPFLLIAGILLILFWKVFFLGQVFYEGDNFHLNIPNKYFLVDEVTHGRLPLWNPYLFTGIPYFADFNIGTLYPLNFLYFLFPVPRALSILVVIDFFLIGSFQYIFLTSLKLSSKAALFGGIIFALSGMPFNLYGNITYLHIVVYIPLLFFLAHRLVEKKTIRWLLLLIGVQAIQFVSGHPQMTYYTMLFISFYLFFFSRFSVKNKFRIISAYIFIPLMLSAVQLMPFIEYAAHATRPIGNIDYASWGSLPLAGYIIFLFPTIFGNHIDGNWWGPQWIIAGYIGVTSLVVGIVGLCKSSFSIKKFAVIGLIFSLLLAMGKLIPLFYLFYYFVPGWSFFRAPSGLMTYYSFFASILVAHGLSYIMTKEISFGRKTFVATFAAFLSVAIFGLLLITTNKPNFWYPIVQLLLTKHVPFVHHLLLYDSIKVQSIFITAFWNIFFFSIFIFLTLLALMLVKRKIFLVYILFFLTVVSLIIPDSKIITSTSLSLYSKNLPVPAILSKTQDGSYRALSLQIDLHQKREHLPGKDFFYQEAKGNINMYKDDNNIERSIYQARGYAALAPGSYATYLHNNYLANVTGVDTTHMTQEQLNQTSVKYLISHEPINNNLYYLSAVNPVATSSGRYYIYENSSAKERAYLLHAVQGDTVLFDKNFPSEILLTVTSSHNDTLILSDWYYPGWKAFVNGKESIIQPYLQTFRSISIPKGTSSVMFVYDPLSLKVGFCISVASCLGFVAFYFWKGKRKIV